jgi:hypothetical protein
MRRSLMLLATVMVLVGLMAAPAAADKPTQIGPFQDVFVDADPCNGTLQEITLNITLFEHQHKNNFVGRSVLTGSTDAGYILTGHHETFVQNKNGERVNFKDMWRNPVTGDKMHATGSFRMVGNSPVVESFDLRCVGGPTIFPTP